ncbi:hypothetical protein [Streptomyces sp. NPDC053560]|uniref:hypothetical protein n=1 Tax=Streptomyces sp. NPDC053560 TaxID=3365711 RepID=UPI0037D49AEB
MRILTIRQPWAAAIIFADKRIENRTWSTCYRGPVLIHAGATLERRHGPAVASVVRGLQLDLGAVIGIARYTGCHADDGQCTPWSKAGHFDHVLDEEVTALPLPIPWRGTQGLTVPPTVLMDRVREQLSAETAAHVLREER